MSAIIYNIHCNETGEDYYGYTKQTLAKRMKSHRNPSANHLANNRLCSSYPIIQRGNYSVKEVEKVEVGDPDKREQWYVINLPCVNQAVPGGDPLKDKEYKNAYYRNYYSTVEGSAKRAEYDKRCREKNKEKYADRQRDYVSRNKQMVADKKYWCRNQTFGIGILARNYFD